MLFLFSREACLAIRESSHESVHSLLKEERRKVGNVQCLWNWPEHGLLRGACSASQFLSCKVNKWSSVGKFLYAMLKKINAEANPNVCHPVLRKFKATSVSKAVSCASFIRVWLLSLGQGLFAQKCPRVFFRCWIPLQVSGSCMRFMLLEIKPPVDVCLQSPFDSVVGLCSSKLFLGCCFHFSGGFV